MCQISAKSLEFCIRYDKNVLVFVPGNCVHLIGGHFATAEVEDPVKINK